MAQAEKHPIQVPRASLGRWALRVDGIDHAARASGIKVEVDGRTVPDSWVNLDEATLTIFTGKRGKAVIQDFATGAAARERAAIGGLIAAALAGCHPEADQPSVKPNRVWSHFLAIGLGIDPQELAVPRHRAAALIADEVLHLSPPISELVDLTMEEGGEGAGPLRPDVEDKPPGHARGGWQARRVPIERHTTDASSYRTVEEQQKLERKELPLVERFSVHLRSLGFESDSILIDAFRVDLVDFSRQLLFEAKFASTVEDVRMAIGQLAHYTYLVERSNPRPFQTVKGEVVLLGGEPSEDVKDFLKELEIGLVWETQDGFRDHPFESILYSFDPLQSA